MCKFNMKELSKEEYFSSKQTAKTMAVIDDRYHIKNVLVGNGNYSKVFVCWDSLDQQIYAVKSISKQKLLSSIHQNPNYNTTKAFFVTSIQSEINMMLRFK